MRRKDLFKHWQCRSCGRRYARDEVSYLCPNCSVDYQPGMPLVGVLEALFDYQVIGERLAGIGSKQLSLEDFCQLFCALDRYFHPPLPVGSTPFFKLGEREGKAGNYWIKNDSLNPSASLKDRASSLMVAEAKRLKLKQIVCASTGNAASSLAAYAASAGMEAVIFVPANAPKAKLAQIMVHGAILNLVDGTYDDAYKAALDYSREHECLNRNTAYHPLTIEGKKTAGLEIYHQNGCKAPDWIVVPTGDGAILAGIHKAFVDLKRSGQIVKLPKLLAAQAASSDAITSYFESGIYSDAEAPGTMADSISVKTPANAHWAVDALKESGGAALRYEDDVVRASQIELARCSGIFAEPSAALCLAAADSAMQMGIIKTEEQVVLLITGHGLKDIAALGE